MKKQVAAILEELLQQGGISHDRYQRIKDEIDVVIYLLFNM